MTKEALTPITWPTVKWLKPSVAEQHKQSTTCGEPVAWMDREGERVVTAKQKAGMHESLQTSFPYALGYTTPPHSFFEDVANELRVEIAELQDHIRLLEKQLSQSQRTAAEGEDTRRAWVGLTTDDWDEIRKQVKYNFEMTTGEYAERVSHLVEDKLREKNT